MGYIIHLEQIKIEREEKIRRVVMREFPWKEIEHLNQYLIDPMVDLWAEPKQVIVKEAVFRLVYEAFILGVKEKKLGKQLHTQQWSDEVQYQQIQQLVQDVMNAFAMFRMFRYKKRTSLGMLFATIAEEWFLRGIRSNFVVN